MGDGGVKGVPAFLHLLFVCVDSAVLDRAGITGLYVWRDGIATAAIQAAVLVPDMRYDCMDKWCGQILRI